jgi:8-oxo-dGTP pyrophosphatase MutT (NUDIX family)
VPIDDPTERFDLFDADGRPLGRTKARGDVHRDGDWHRSVHVWVLLVGRPGHSDEPRVLLQRRSLTKDSHPGKVDVSVAGHLRAGETPLAVLREAEEEVGLALAESDLTPLGERRRVDVRPPHHVDREHQTVYLATTSRPLASLRPDPDEVSGLLVVRLSEAIALAGGAVRRVAADELRAGDDATRAVMLEASELLPSPDGYFPAALAAIRAHAAGETPTPLRLGHPVQST